MTDETRLRLKTFAKRYRMIDRSLWQLLVSLEEQLDEHVEPDAAWVVNWLEAHDVKLVPWQKDRLGVE